MPKTKPHMITYIHNLNTWEAKAVPGDPTISSGFRDDAHGTCTSMQEEKHSYT